MLNHKLCKACNTEKDINEFYSRTRNGKYIGVNHPCKLCWSSKSKKRWQKDKIEILKRHKEIRIDNKKRAIEYLGGKCQDCKYTFHIAAFDFHHFDNTKENDIGAMLMHRWTNIVKELDKCLLLCANCHRIRHYINFN